MGVTTRGLPYPEDEDLVRLGANDIQELAEAVDDELADLDSGRPRLFLIGKGVDVDADLRLKWDDAAPVLSLGSWATGGGAGFLVQPPEPGLYLVTLNHKFDRGSAGVGPPPDTMKVDLYIETKVESADQSTAVVEAREQWMIEYDTTPRLALSQIVLVDDTPDLGIQARVVTDVLTSSTGSTTDRLRIIQLSRI